MVALRTNVPHVRFPENATSNEATRRLVEHFRKCALDCRVKPRQDAFRACALLAVDGSQPVRAHMEALIQCLPGALGKRALFYRPGSPEMTFDEAWLSQLSISLRDSDHLSAEFLLNSRVAPMHRRHIGFLAMRIASHGELF